MTPGCSVTPHPRPARDGALTSGRPARRFLGPVPRPTAHRHPPRCTAPSSRGRHPGARALRTVSSPLGGRLLPVRATWAQRAGVSHDAVSEGGRWTKGPTIFLPRTRVRTAVRYFQGQTGSRNGFSPTREENSPEAADSRCRRLVSGRGRRRRARAGAGSCPPPRGRGDPGQRPRSVNPVSTAHLQSGRATLLRAAVCTSNPCADARRWGLQGETEKGPCAGAGRSLEQGAERQQRRPVCGGAGRGTRWHSPSLTGAEMSPRLVQTVGPEAAGAWAGGHLPSRFGIGRT